MQNKVAHTLAKSFLKLNFAALRFNFRGVGKSEGQFADGVGEAEDVLSAVAEARRRFPGLPLWLAGFSFGAAMAIRVAVAADADGLVSVAPAAHRFAGKLRDQPACPWLIIHAEADELIPIEESIEWVDGLEPGPELVVFPGTSHFFHGQLVTLRDTVQAFVTANHAQSPPTA
jgi:alpha/beta superfamily hydrolase